MVSTCEDAREGFENTAQQGDYYDYYKQGNPHRLECTLEPWSS